MSQSTTPQPVNPVRGELDIAGRRLSYLDFGGSGRVLLALHGHLSEGLGFTDLARELAPTGGSWPRTSGGTAIRTGRRTIPARATSRTPSPCSTASVSVRSWCSAIPLAASTPTSSPRGILTW